MTFPLLFKLIVGIQFLKILILVAPVDNWTVYCFTMRRLLKSYNNCPTLVDVPDLPVYSTRKGVVSIWKTGVRFAP